MGIILTLGKLDVDSKSDSSRSRVCSSLISSRLAKVSSSMVAVAKVPDDDDFGDGGGGSG